MSTCTSNTALGLIGCGATYTGRRQHSVARVTWSDHPDGRAHLTFSNEANADKCWRGDVMRHPSEAVTKTGTILLALGDDGVWRRPGEQDPRFRRGVSTESDETDPSAIQVPGGLF